MKRFKKWITAGVALSMVAILAGCATTGKGATIATNVTNPSTTTKAMPGANNASNPPTSTNPLTNDSVTNTTQMVPTTNTTTSTAGAVPLTLENIQYENNGLLLIMTHGTMTTTYSDPHFTTTATNQFVVTLRNTSSGKYSLNQVKPINSNWAKSMVITTKSNDLILTFDLKQTFHSLQAGVGGGFEIQFSFK